MLVTNARLGAAARREGGGCILISLDLTFSRVPACPESVALAVARAVQAGVEHECLAEDDPAGSDSERKDAMLIEACATADDGSDLRLAKVEAVLTRTVRGASEPDARRRRDLAGSLGPAVVRHVWDVYHPALAAAAREREHSQSLRQWLAMGRPDQAAEQEALWAKHVRPHLAVAAGRERAHL